MLGAFFDAVLADDECLAHGALADSDTDTSLYFRLLMSKISARQALCQQARPEYGSAEQVVDQRRRHSLSELADAAQGPA